MNDIFDYDNDDNSNCQSEFYIDYFHSLFPEKNKSLNEEKLEIENYTSIIKYNDNNSFNSSKNYFSLTRQIFSESHYPNFNIDKNYTNTNKSFSQLLKNKKKRKNSNSHSKTKNNKQTLKGIIKENEVKSKNKIMFKIDIIKHKHTKFSRDNVIKGIKGLLIKICLEGFNSELKKCKINSLKEKKLLKLELNYIHKTSFIDHLNYFSQKIGNILKGNISKKYKNKENNNSDLIKEIERINNEGNSSEKIAKIINFLDMTMENFLNCLILYLWPKHTDQKKNGVNNNDIVDSILKEESKELIDNYLNKKCHNTANYRQRFEKILKNLPNDIIKMKKKT